MVCFKGFKELRLRNWETPRFDPRSLDAVVSSHAHIDHSGYLPLLCKRGYQGPIYCTAGTADLLRILLPDVAHLMEEAANYANRQERGAAAFRLHLQPNGHLLRCRKYHLMRTAAQSKWLNSRRRPMVINAGSSTRTGGSILHHLGQRLPDRRNTVLLCGYLVHGEAGPAKTLAAVITDRLGWTIEVAKDGMTVPSIGAKTPGEYGSVMPMSPKEPTQEYDVAARRLTLATILGSMLLSATLLAVYRIFRSQLALAQAADSLFDMIGGLALLWAVSASTRPADIEHPQGHSLAQPVAALIVAVLAGVLSAEVLRSAVGALLSVSRPALDWPVALVFAAKVIFKATILTLAAVLLRSRRNPALSALRMDARNDVLVGSLACVGFLLTRAGLPRIDAALAIGVAVYIAYSGLRLGRENVSLLLGESASSERLQELAALACSVPGIHAANAVVAVWRGSLLHVELSATVDSTLTLRAAHDIGHTVEQRLLLDPDVGHAVVHIEPD